MGGRETGPHTPKAGESFSKRLLGGRGAHHARLCSRLLGMCHNKIIGLWPAEGSAGRAPGLWIMGYCTEHTEKRAECAPTEGGGVEKAGSGDGASPHRMAAAWRGRCELLDVEGRPGWALAQSWQATGSASQMQPLCKILSPSLQLSRSE